MLHRSRTHTGDVLDVHPPNGGGPTALIPAPRSPAEGDGLPDAAGPSAPPSAPKPSKVPRFPGELGVVLSTAPVFRHRMRGYDRVQVDDYVTWAEAELRTQSHAADEVVSRFQACAADLELSRQLLTHSAEGQHLVDVSQQAGRLLAVAADQAAEVAAAGAAEAHRLVTEARAQGQASLEKARAFRQKVLAVCGSLREQAQQDRAEAREALAQARLSAAELLRHAAEEREQADQAAAAARERAAAESAAQLREEAERARLEQQAAAEAAAGRLAAAHRELDELDRQKQETIGFLRSADACIDQALARLDRGRPPIARLTG